MGKRVVKKRTSKQQIKANRKNAGKSTGPRTAEGKDRSRLNALKHGLRAEHVVVLKGPDPENPEEFDALQEGLLADRQPCGVLEQMLVERLAVGFWRLRRAYRFEAESIAQANKPNPVLEMLAEHMPLPVGERGTQILPTKANMDKLVRYESMIDRELLRTLAQLRLLQQQRKLNEAPSDSQVERPTRPLHAPRPPNGPPQDAAKPQRPNEPIPQPSASARTTSVRTKVEDPASMRPCGRSRMPVIERPEFAFRIPRHPGERKRFPAACFCPPAWRESSAGLAFSCGCNQTSSSS